MKALIGRARKTNVGLRSRPAATRDLPTIAFFRAGPLLRRNGPVGILAAHRPGAIMDKSGRRFVVLLDVVGRKKQSLREAKKRNNFS